MEKKTRSTYTLTPEDTREALADWINRGDENVDEEEMTVSFNFGTLDEQRSFPTIIVTHGDI